MIGRGNGTTMINAPVLVLNQNYEPLNVCDIRRAFRLLGAAKAELLARNHQVIHTPTISIPAPSVIRLQHHVKRPQPGPPKERAKSPPGRDLACHGSGLTLLSW